MRDFAAWLLDVEPAAVRQVQPLNVDLPAGVAHSDLWQMRAEALLARGRPALLTLIGQTRIEEPARVVPQAVTAIGQVTDDADRSRLYTAVTSLIRDESLS